MMDYKTLSPSTVSTEITGLEGYFALRRVNNLHEWYMHLVTLVNKSDTQ